MFQNSNDPSNSLPRKDTVSFEEVWKTLQLSKVNDFNQTLKPPREVTLLSSELDTFSSSAELVNTEMKSNRKEEEGEKRIDWQEKIDTKEVLAKGGMGVIHRAIQHSLSREVAVKSLREKCETTFAHNELLREARMTGFLEHPNIIPIYTLNEGEQGELQIVMKRISGVVWQKLLNAIPHEFSNGSFSHWSQRNIDRYQSSNDALESESFSNDALELEASSKRECKRTEDPKEADAPDWTKTEKLLRSIHFHGVSDPLTWHLRILIQVCNAVSFAHSRGILHRDLKPENVMIGEFGEVYVLDWGLAVSLEEKDRGRFPLASDINHIAGTPGYMAPEMVAQKVEEIGIQTDVYLLGSILHQIVTTKPRHIGYSLFQVMYSAYYSVPFDYDSEVPKELVRICHRATNRKPELRHQSVEEFRQDLFQFLERRNADVLYEEALDKMEQLEQILLSEVEVGSSDALEQENQYELFEESSSERHQRIYSLFSACRFGFQQALRIWPEHQPSLDGTLHLLSDMIEYEIEREAIVPASLLCTELSELFGTQDVFEQKLEDLRAMLVQKSRNLQELKNEMSITREKLHDLKLEKRLFEEQERERDPDIYGYYRGRVAMGIGVIWCFLPIIYQFLEVQRLYEMDRWDYLTSTLVFVMILGAGVYTFWEFLTETKYNQQVLWILVVLSLGLLFSRLGGVAMKLDLNTIVSFDMLVGALVIANFASFEKKLFVSAAVYGIGFLLSAFWTEYVFFIIGFVNLVGLSYMAHVWDPERPYHKIYLRNK